MKASGQDIHAVTAQLVAEAAPRIVECREPVGGGCLTLSKLAAPDDFLLAVAVVHPGLEVTITSENPE